MRAWRSDGREMGEIDVDHYKEHTRILTNAKELVQKILKY
jgi:hypothetical protein